MQSGKFNVVTDGQWGSTGKGLISAALAARYMPEIISTTNMANAGHTAIDDAGKIIFIAKALPAPAIVRRWILEYDPHILIGPSAAFNIDQLMKEITETGSNYQLSIHPRAGVITDEHKQAEADLKTGTKHLASTMQGCGTMLADKVMRRKELKLARDYPELAGHMVKDMGIKLEGKNPQIRTDIAGLSMPLALNMLMEKHGFTILHEGSQGFSLCINHGSHYPQCTSRSTTAMQNMTDMGLTHRAIGDIYLVIRPAPIRVGNVIEDGKQVGYSGDCYEDHEETTWAQIAANAGAPEEVTKGELTTVTKRLRRVFTFSKQQIIEAVAVNGANKIALNFANYVDWSCYGTNDYQKLPKKVFEFIEMIEDLVNVPVTVVGTGPNNNHVCFLD